MKEDENKQSHEFLLKSFSDSDVYSIFVYFRSKLDERGDDGVAKVEASNSDCFRICSSVLLCAGRVLPENVVKLQDEVRHSLERMEGTGNCNAVPLIAAQCLWGSAENVSSSIGSALSSLMAIELDDADRHRTPVKNVSIVKTRQGKRGEHKRIDSGVSMTPVVALRALNCILAGVDPSAKASRQAILSSDSACHFIEVSLERALHAAEVVLNASEVSDEILMVVLK